ncbi:MAG TPA: DUF3887 domain-containing protein, partial [Levilinea sp.]|nr:DUF3887 domain-containing protein [Levilinea sp.]
LVLKLMILILISSLLLAACAPGAESITGEELTAVAEWSAPIAEGILSGMKNADHNTFVLNFNDQMKSAFTPGEFDAMLNDLGGRLGAYDSHELSGAERVEGGFIAVFYRTRFEKASVTMRVIHEEAEPYLVAGLWFR